MQICDAKWTLTHTHMHMSSYKQNLLRPNFSSNFKLTLVADLKKGKRRKIEGFNRTTHTNFMTH